VVKKWTLENGTGLLWLK